MSAVDTASAPAARVERLYRYPLKGFSPEPLTTATVEAGGCMPFDRAYAIENGGGRFDPLQPKPPAQDQFPDVDAQ